MHQGERNEDEKKTKKKRERGETEREMGHRRVWVGRSIFSNLAQEEAIFSVLDGQINTAFQTFISARRHKRLLHSSPGRKGKKKKKQLKKLYFPWSQPYHRLSVNYAFKARVCVQEFSRETL